MTEKDRDELAEVDRGFFPPETEAESGGFVDREEAVHILGVSGTTFDRLAPKEFESVRVTDGSSFLYPVKELEAYREYRKHCKQNKKTRLTWSEITALVPTLEERIRVLSWVLSPTFVEGETNNKSALRLQKDRPKDYDRAKRVLKELGFDMDELRHRLEKGDSSPSKPNPLPRVAHAFDEPPSF